MYLLSEIRKYTNISLGEIVPCLILMALSDTGVVFLLYLDIVLVTPQYAKKSGCFSLIVGFPWADLGCPNNWQIECLSITFCDCHGWVMHLRIKTVTGLSLIKSDAKIQIFAMD